TTWARHWPATGCVPCWRTASRPRDRLPGWRTIRWQRCRSKCCRVRGGTRNPAVSRKTCVVGDISYGTEKLLSQQFGTSDQGRKRVHPTRPRALSVRLGGIPEELRERAQWLCWEYRQVRGKRAIVTFAEAAAARRSFFPNVMERTDAENLQRGNGNP